MKTSVFIKVFTCLVMTFVTFQAISYILDSNQSINRYRLLSQGSELKYQRMVKTYLTDLPKRYGIKNDPGADLNDLPSAPSIEKPLLVDVNEIMKHDSSNEKSNQKRIVVDLKNIVSKVKVDDSLNKKAIKSLLNQDQNKTDNDTDNAQRKREIQSLSERFLSSGFGLQSIKSKSGDLIWMENGVIYQPIEKDATAPLEKHPSQRLTNYEPFVPFNKTVFFSESEPSSHFPQMGKKTDNSKEIKEKIILWYTPARYTPKDSVPQPLRFCPDFPCRMTIDQKYFNQSSLVVFNGQRVGPKPPERYSSSQLFMFHNQEPPIDRFFEHTKFHSQEWRGAFNWTMTYRTDSTFPSYYGIVRKHPNPPKKDYKAILSKKNGTVAWMVSHCGSPSKRDKYVDILRKYINVDIYGACGNFKCDRKNDEKCNADIAEKYKFYLGFENGICPDYVSEKFFRFMPLDIVTVSRAMKGNLDFRAVHGTHVDTSDYESPKKLAEYLTFLDNNDDEYIKILQEKDKYIYLFEDYSIRLEDGSIKYIHYHYEAVPFCQVCQKLWNLKEGARHKIGDIGEWFDRKLCVEPDDLVI